MRPESLAQLARRTNPRYDVGIAQKRRGCDVGTERVRYVGEQKRSGIETHQPRLEIERDGDGFVRAFDARTDAPLTFDRIAFRGERDVDVKLVDGVVGVHRLLLIDGQRRDVARPVPSVADLQRRMTLAKNPLRKEAP